MRWMLLFLAALWSSSAASSAQAQELPRYALGVAVPTTGKYAPLGKQIVESARLAAAEKGLRLIVADTEGDPGKAVTAVTTLADDPTVVAILGPIGVRESQAAAAAAQRAQVPLFTLSTNEAVNGVGGWVFRVRPSPAEQARALADVAFDQLAMKTAAVMYPKIPYGDEASRAFAERFIARGGKVTAVANYPEDTTNFADVLDVVVGKKVYLGKKGTVGKWRTDASGFARIGSRPRVDFEVLFIPDFHYRVARILSFLPGAGIQNGDGGEGVAVQLLGLSGWQGKTMEMSGGMAAGAMYLDTFAGDSAGGRQEEFARTFEAATGRRPANIEAEAFDTTWLIGALVEAAHKGGSGGATMRTDLVNSLPVRNGWTGVAGTLRFGTRGEPLRVLGIYRFDSDGSVAPAF